MTDITIDKDQSSGEIFDLSVPTFNNKFGCEYIKGTITHGISLPLEKYIRELEMILYGGEKKDDKSDKRRKRLEFLRICNENQELKMLFPIFTNYLNGGGENIEKPYDEHGYRRATFNDFNYQYTNNIIITVAGGNIVTTFAQLLMNMIDIFIRLINKYNPNSKNYIDDDYYKWDLKNNYKNTEYKDDTSIQMANKIFQTNFNHWHSIDIKAMEEGFKNLTKTNQILIQKLSKETGNKEIYIYFKICKFILDSKEKTSHGNHYNIMSYIANSNHSDFDFKLSPNKHINSEEVIDYLYTQWNKLPNDTTAGFLLVRVKSYIICNLMDNDQKKNLKEYKKDCYHKLSIEDFKQLYPQMANSFMLGKVPKESDCYKFINYLLNEKKAIADATYNNVNEILKYFLTGYYKPSNILGEVLPVVSSSENYTEAIINYLKTTSFYLNMYIKYWEQKYNSPNYNIIITYFLGLNNVLGLNDEQDKSNKYLIPKLCAGIINHFLNNPEMQTERILDNIIENINKERKKKKYNNLCYMPHSNLQLISGNKKLTPGLQEIKKELESFMDNPNEDEDEDTMDIEYDENEDYSETPAHEIPLPPGRRLGFPDGIKITMNAITTEKLAPDTFLNEIQLNEIEDSEMQNMYKLKLPLSDYSIDLSQYGGKYKIKKHKIKKHKTKKFKKLKKKSKKIDKKNKNNITYKKNTNNIKYKKRHNKKKLTIKY